MSSDSKSKSGYETSFSQDVGSESMSLEFAPVGSDPLRGQSGTHGKNTWS